MTIVEIDRAIKRGKPVIMAETRGGPLESITFVKRERSHVIGTYEVDGKVRTGKWHRLDLTTRS